MNSLEAASEIIQVSEVHDPNFPDWKAVVLVPGLGQLPAKWAVPLVLRIGPPAEIERYADTLRGAMAYTLNAFLVRADKD